MRELRELDERKTADVECRFFEALGYARGVMDASPHPQGVDPLEFAATFTLRVLARYPDIAIRDGYERYRSGSLSV
jgi:hypothetical protein